MNNPYKLLDIQAFWKTGVENSDITFPEKIYNPTWKINDTDKIATMGSCFAQHIAKWLRENGFNVPFYDTKGFNEEETEKKLGHPRSIIRDLTEGHRKVERPLPGSEKVIALSPFFATISFLILGFGFDLWHPGWMVFLLIPVIAIIMSMGKTKEEHLTTALSPFAAVVIFLLLGFIYNLWHPGWMVFLIIPVLAIWNSRYTMRKIDLLTALSPFVAVVSYTILGLNGYWVEGWVVFLIIPMFGIFNYPNKKVMLLWESLLIGGVAVYLYLILYLEISQRLSQLQSQLQLQHNRII